MSGCVCACVCVCKDRYAHPFGDVLLTLAVMGESFKQSGISAGCVWNYDRSQKPSSASSPLPMKQRARHGGEAKSLLALRDANHPHDGDLFSSMMHGKKHGFQVKQRVCRMNIQI